MSARFERRRRVVCSAAASGIRAALDCAASAYEVVDRPILDLPIRLLL
jgi:hypothetical protein